MAGSAPIPVGRIAGYQVVGKIGAGAMGTVYKAVDLKLHRTVALKFVAEDDVPAEDRERLLREARAASALDHPNIATVHSVGETEDGRLFLDMAYYEGQTLAETLARGPIQSAKAIAIVSQVARGLAYAHQHHVVHRDIKPSNIVLTTDGIAKIVDFGLAHIHSANAATESVGLLGTIYYMSPEQAQGRALDARTDIWSLGVVLYQLLAGRLPFQADSPGATLLAILQNPPAPLTGVSEELQLIILRALSKQAAARYQTCTEMLADLDALTVDDQAVTLAPSRNLLRELKAASAAASPTRSKGRYAALTAVMLVCALVGVGVTLLVNPVRTLLFGPAQKHIAVLPFEVPANEAGTRNLADGLMESIAGKLSNLDAGQQSLWVVPSSEIRKRKIDDPSVARRELGATIAIKGTVHSNPEGFHLTVDVIDTGSMRLLGSASMSKSTASLATLDDDAVESLAGILHIGTHPLPAAANPNTLGSAYESYLKGRGLLQDFYKPGNLDTAIQLFEESVAADPKFALAYSSLGEAYWEKYRVEKDPSFVAKARSNCDRAIQLNDKLPSVFVTSARIHDGIGQHDLALQEFDRALKLDARSADAQLGLAAVFEHLGRLGEAEAAFKTAVTLRPDYWLGIYELGAFYNRQRRKDDAIREFRRVLEIAPDSSQAHSNLAAALQSAGNYKEAESELRRSLAIEPSYAAYANLGMLFYRQKRWPDSVEATEKALKLNPNNYLVWSNLGIAYEQMGDAHKAAAAYAEELKRLLLVARLDPNSESVQCDLAVLYSKQKLRGEAVRYIEAALVRGPDNPTTLSDAAEVYENLGDHSHAIELLNKAFSKGQTLAAAEQNPGLRSLLLDPAVRKP